MVEGMTRRLQGHERGGEGNQHGVIPSGLEEKGNQEPWRKMHKQTGNSKKESLVIPGY